MLTSFGSVLASFVSANGSVCVGLGRYRFSRNQHEFYFTSTQETTLNILSFVSEIRKETRCYINSSH